MTYKEAQARLRKGQSVYWLSSNGYHFKVNTIRKERGIERVRLYYTHPRFGSDYITIATTDNIVLTGEGCRCYINRGGIRNDTNSYYTLHNCRCYIFWLLCWIGDV